MATRGEHGDDSTGVGQGTDGRPDAAAGPTPDASAERLRLLFDNMLEGYAYCRMVFDAQGEPDDFIYLDVNRAFHRLRASRTWWAGTSRSWSRG